MAYALHSSLHLASAARGRIVSDVAICQRSALSSITINRYPGRYQLGKPARLIALTIDQKYSSADAIKLAALAALQPPLQFALHHAEAGQGAGTRIKLAPN
jgi:hypothetical protein